MIGGLALITSLLHKEQEEQIRNSLIDFVVRVCDYSKPKRDVEIAVLPEIINVLLDRFA